MQRFTRTHITQGGATRPQSVQTRVYGEKVSMGDPLVLDNDADLRRQVETSLEMVAKERLLEAESQAAALMGQAQAEAARLLEKANAQAKETLAAAQAQVTEIQDAAHEAGFKTGFQEGYADATEQVSQETIELLQGAQVLAEGAYAAERRVLKDFEKHAVQLIEHVARRILHRELSDSPELLLQMIQQAIESLYLTGKVKVAVSAQVIQDLRRFSAQTGQALIDMNRFEFVADPGLELHQLYIISQEGSFDVSPNAQLKQLMAPLEKNLKLPRPEAPAVAAPDVAVSGPDQSGETEDSAALSAVELTDFGHQAKYSNPSEIASAEALSFEPELAEMPMEVSGDASARTDDSAENLLDDQVTPLSLDAWPDFAEELGLDTGVDGDGEQA